MKTKKRKILEKMKENTSGILFNLCMIGFVNDKDTLKEIANDIDDLYDNYEKLLKIIKKQIE